MSFRSEFPFSSGRLGAVALAALLIGAGPLAGCRDFGDMTGSIASTRQPLPTDEAALRAYADDWGKRYDGNPGEKVASINYARALRGLTRYSEAAAVMQAAAVKAPQDFEVLGAYGKALADDGQLATGQGRSGALLYARAAGLDDHVGAGLGRRPARRSRRRADLLSRRAEDRPRRAVDALQPRPVLRADQAVARGRGGVARSLRQPARRRARAPESRAGAGARSQVRRSRADQPAGHDARRRPAPTSRRSGR